jgi:hypothetical protein
VNPQKRRQPKFTKIPISPPRAAPPFVTPSNSAVGQSSDIGGTGNGGAVYNNGTLTALCCVFIGNLAVGGSSDVYYFSPVEPGGLANGGALFNANQATFINCVFSNNTATGGDGQDAPAGSGGVYYAGGVGGAANGGAICNTGSLIASNNTFALNLAAGGQGGMGGEGNEGIYAGLPSGPGGTGGGGNASGGGFCCLSPTFATGA